MPPEHGRQSGRGMFHHCFFPADKEGPIVHVLCKLSRSASGKCRQAVRVASYLGENVAWDEPLTWKVRWLAWHCRTSITPHPHLRSTTNVPIESNALRRPIFASSDHLPQFMALLLSEPRAIAARERKQPFLLWQHSCISPSSSMASWNSKPKLQGVRTLQFWYFSIFLRSFLSPCP